MKRVALFFAFIFSFASSGWGQTGYNGVDNDGFIGVYEVNDQYYWWLCVEPEGTPAANFGNSFLADDLSFSDGWDQQNTERQAAYSGNPTAQAALAKQITVMQYVLDEYLPIATLTTPGALLEGSENADHYGNNEAFYNSMFAVQHFLAETYGKTTKVDFTDLSDYIDRWSGDLSAAGIARSDLFQDILADVAAQDGLNFFDTYTATFDDYYIANTLFPLGDPDNWQDALIIAVPVPEPSGAMLIGCFGFAVMVRRWRKLA